MISESEHAVGVQRWQRPAVNIAAFGENPDTGLHVQVRRRRPLPVLQAVAVIRRRSAGGDEQQARQMLLGELAPADLITWPMQHGDVLGRVVHKS